MTSYAVPIISVVIGEGGSGGALAIGICDRLVMLQYSVYSVNLARGLRIHPLEGPMARRKVAAEAMGVTADRLAGAESGGRSAAGAAGRGTTATLKPLRRISRPR